jgi:hypothetical protein
MVLNLEQQKLIHFSHNHKLKDSRGILEIEVIIAVVVLSLASHEHVVQATRAKPKHTSSLNQATLSCLNH